MRRRVGNLLALVTLALLVSSCASTDSHSDTENVSTIPWDHPEKWESGSGMPGINSNPGGY